MSHRTLAWAMLAFFCRRGNGELPNGIWKVSSFCDDLEGWAGRVEGRFKRKGIYVYIQLIHVAVQQKLTQHCKAIILQLKNKLRKEIPPGLYSGMRTSLGVWLEWYLSSKGKIRIGILVKLAEKHYRVSPIDLPKWKLLSRVQVFATPWTIQSMECSRPEYWSG